MSKFFYYNLLTIIFTFVKMIFFFLMLFINGYGSYGTDKESMWL